MKDDAKKSLRIEPINMSGKVRCWKLLGKGYWQGKISLLNFPFVLANLSKIRKSAMRLSASLSDYSQQTRRLPCTCNVFHVSSVLTLIKQCSLIRMSNNYTPPSLVSVILLPIKNVNLFDDPHSRNLSHFVTQTVAQKFD